MKSWNQLQEVLTEMGELLEVYHQTPNKIPNDAAKRLKAEYKKVFGKAPKETCKSCIMDHFLELRKVNKNQYKTIMNSKYKLKEGVRVDTVWNPIKGVPLHVSNANLTDEIAKKLIKSNEKFLDYFAQYPNQDNQPEAEPVNVEDAVYEGNEVEIEGPTEDVSYEDMELNELRAEAKSQGVKGNVSRMRKETLITKLNEL